MTALPVVCVDCGAFGHGFGRPRLRCKECYAAHRRRYANEAARLRRGHQWPTQCQHCGKPMEAKPNKLVCGWRCRYEAGAGVWSEETRTCQRCEKPFREARRSGSSYRKMYCSLTCRFSKARKTGTCERCGMGFGHRQSRPQRYCSNHCANTVKAIGRTPPRPSQAVLTAKAIARELAAPVEIMCSLNWWLCADCGCEVRASGRPNGRGRVCVECSGRRSKQSALRHYYQIRRPQEFIGDRICLVCDKQFQGLKRPACSVECGKELKKLHEVSRKLTGRSLYELDQDVQLRIRNIRALNVRIWKEEMIRYEHKQQAG
jgi:hypothetical protein